MICHWWDILNSNISKSWKRGEDRALFMTSILPPLIIVKECMGFKEEPCDVAKIMKYCSKVMVHCFILVNKVLKKRLCALSTGLRIKIFRICKKHVGQYQFVIKSSLSAFLLFHYEKDLGKYFHLSCLCLSWIFCIISRKMKKKVSSLLLIDYYIFNLKILHERNLFWMFI